MKLREIWQTKIAPRLQGPWPRMRSAIIYVAIGSPFCVWGASYLLHNLLNPEAVNRIDIWFQFAFGNWPNWKGVLDSHSFWFSGAVAFRFFWVFGTLFGLGALLARLLSWRRILAMKYKELFQDRDQIIETQLLQIFPPDEQEEYRKKIQKAIDRGGHIWEDKFLPSAFGSQKADQVKRALDKQAV
jgi:hypothetical protein